MIICTSSSSAQAAATFLYWLCILKLQDPRDFILYILPKNFGVLQKMFRGHQKVLLLPMMMGLSLDKEKCQFNVSELSQPRMIFFPDKVNNCVIFPIPQSQAVF